MPNAACDLASTLFRMWRRLLTAIACGCTRAWVHVRDAAARWAAGWLPVRAYLADPVAAWSGDSPARLMPAVAFGLRAFAAGLLISAGVALGTGVRLPAAGLVILTELLWVAARLAIIVLLTPTGLPRSRALAAFAAGLAPYAFGITPLLRLGSLGLSAVLTARGLRGAGAAAGTVRLATGWAFGGQAAIMAGGVALRGLLAAIGGL